MNQTSESLHLLETLIKPGQRLPMLMDRLYNQIWSFDKMATLGPEKYLLDGEQTVFQMEELILSAAPGLYDELAAQVMQTGSVLKVFKDEQPTALVIFDGLSIRELPFIEKLADKTAYKIIKRGYGFAALPSETNYFIEQRVLGKAVSPVELHRRKELQELGIKVFYYEAPIKTYSLSSENRRLLLWSQFPDSTFKDMGARFASHFAAMQDLFDQVWKNIIMTIPRGYQIIITSDHGYIFFGAGLDSNRSADAAKVLDQGRFKVFQNHETIPDDVPELQMIPEKRLAMLRGRIKNRPQGPAAANAYRHGGFSLMEMLTPWLMIEKQ